MAEQQRGAKKDGATPILAPQTQKACSEPKKPPPSPRYEQKRNSAGVGDEDVEHFCPKMGSPKNTHGGRAVKAKVFFFVFLKESKVKKSLFLFLHHILS